jgi:hypothetical protein
METLGPRGWHSPKLEALLCSTRIVENRRKMAVRSPPVPEGDDEISKELSEEVKNGVFWGEWKRLGTAILRNRSREKGKVQ